MPETQPHVRPLELTDQYTFSVRFYANSTAIVDVGHVERTTHRLVWTTLAQLVSAAPSPSEAAAALVVAVRVAQEQGML